MKKVSVIIFMFFISIGFANAQQTEQLLIFLQPETELSKAFTAGVLPEIKAYAEQSNLTVKVLDIKDGAPEVVKLTPLLVYQNHLGRSFYAGRYSQLSKLKNFIRTVKRIPQEIAGNQLSGKLVWKNERTNIVAPIKITPLAGDYKGINEAAFHKQAKAAVEAAMQHFEVIPTFDLGPTDRRFYIDFHPYASADGKLFISTKIFSQFSCIDPIFVSNTATEGTMQSLDLAFAEAAKMLENEITNQYQHSSIGDAFDPVPANTPEVSWKKLGLKLPKAPKNENSGKHNHDMTIASSWGATTPVEKDAPMVLFKFPAPLDYYSGEAKDLNVTLDLNDKLGLHGAKGSGVVQVSSITMGDIGLDGMIYDKYIEGEKYPTASYDFKVVADKNQPLKFSETTHLQLEGTFKMRGIEYPLNAASQMELLLAADGTPRIQVSASFSLPLMEPFGIEGPDGPAPQNDTLEFHLSFLLAPVKTQP